MKLATLAIVIAIALYSTGCRKPCYGQCKKSERCVEWGNGSKFDCVPETREWPSAKEISQ